VEENGKPPGKDGHERPARRERKDPYEKEPPSTSVKKKKKKKNLKVEEGGVKSFYSEKREALRRMGRVSREKGVCYMNSRITRRKKTMLCSLSKGRATVGGGASEGVKKTSGRILARRRRNLEKK